MGVSCLGTAERCFDIWSMSDRQRASCPTCVGAADGEPASETAYSRVLGRGRTVRVPPILLPDPQRRRRWRRRSCAGAAYVMSSRRRCRGSRCHQRLLGSCVGNPHHRLSIPGDRAGHGSDGGRAGGNRFGSGRRADKIREIVDRLRAACNRARPDQTTRTKLDSRSALTALLRSFTCAGVRNCRFMFCRRERRGLAS